MLNSSTENARGVVGVANKHYQPSPSTIALSRAYREEKMSLVHHNVLLSRMNRKNEGAHEQDGAAYSQEGALDKQRRLQKMQPPFKPRTDVRLSLGGSKSVLDTIRENQGSKEHFDVDSTLSTRDIDRKIDNLESYENASPKFGNMLQRSPRFQDSTTVLSK